MLALEDGDLEDPGVSDSLAFDPASATPAGTVAQPAPEFGWQATDGLNVLFAPDPLEDRTWSEDTSRLSMEAAYGFPVFDGHFTGSPHVGFALAMGAPDDSIGWRLVPEAALATDLSFGLKATHRESDTAEPEHTVGFEVSARW